MTQRLTDNLRLAVIGTFYGRLAESRACIRRVLFESTRPPDEFWIMCETEEDVDNVYRVLDERGKRHTPSTTAHIKLLPTPRNTDGSYTVIPYSKKINLALDSTSADAIVYLDNGSMPHPMKYEVMAAVLGSSISLGAVYCSQHRTGYRDEYSWAEHVVPDAFCVLNYTQVMHRPTVERWTTDMRFANPDVADAMFWRSLHEHLGPFYPVPTGDVPMDDHHIPSPAANGM